MSSTPLASPTSLAKASPAPSTHSALSPAPTAVDRPAPPKKDARFWLIFLALFFCCFLAALDLTAVSTALPAIAAEFESSEFSWVGSAYALTSTALIPWTGGLAAIFGRRPVMIAAILLFALGSALTGAAQSMAMVIGGRSVQGVGGGAILTMVEIIVCDLVPLAERGAYFGIIGAVWALASTLGPPIGGALASAGAWRWLFYLNLPLAGLALTLTAVFLRVKTPQTTLKEKLERMDYWNVVFVAAATSTILGLTWGGSTYSWSSFRVLVPLILGLVGMVAFMLIERSFVKYPTVPFDILAHRNAILGYFATFLHSVAVLGVIYWLPVYFQMRGDSAVQSGVKLFPLSFTIAPFAIIVGASVTITGHYVAQNLLGWAFATVGAGLYTLLEYDSGPASWAGFSVVAGIGLGMLYAATNFPILAPLKPSQQPYAITFFGFVRSFGQLFGITISSTIMSNQLSMKLPDAFVGGEITGDAAYALIPQIKNLAEPLRTEVQIAFADSLVVLWQVLIGICGLGFLVSIGLKSLPLTMETDAENWGLEDRSKAKAPQGGEEEKVGGGGK
ncbi:major facilitator superfamily domain-containing protein [Rhodotorula diobovata]|uniref:Major facilitator superfamily domain-containing protein n=1 Tax=Rhodotorula diobovata TaxID=5288 RepID=A0A5C5FVA4_9BASI|nr:major facilitator superfamily domain-containing protein [Rhodotorula diobovata]